MFTRGFGDLKPPRYNEEAPDSTWLLHLQGQNRRPDGLPIRLVTLRHIHHLDRCDGVAMLSSIHNLRTTLDLMQECATPLDAGQLAVRAAVQGRPAAQV
jgi:hypothetical protein